MCPLLSAAGPFTHSWLQQTHTQQRDTALDSLDEDLPHDVCVCVPGEYWGGGGLHRSAVLEEKQDTAPHLVLSHVLCMPAMSGRDPGCVCELRGTHCINTVLSLRGPNWYSSAPCGPKETFKVLSSFVPDSGAAGL